MYKLKDNELFIISCVVFVIINIYAIVSNEEFVSISNKLFVFFTNKFAWLYLLMALIFVAFVLFIAFSKYGNIKLGKDDEKPEYSTLSWFAMLFCAGMGVGLVFWGVSEPVSHYISTLGGGASSDTAADFAFKSVFMHWGIHPWSCYAVVGLAIAYFKFRKNKSIMISSTVSNVIGSRIVLKIVDFLAVFATVAGIVTSLGLGSLQVSSGLNLFVDLPNNMYTQIIIVAVVTCIFIFSAVSGINKGVKLLSNINLFLAIFLTSLCFVVGPHIEILNNLVHGVGLYLNEFIKDSLNISSYGDNSWTYSWRVFYWAWWIAWAPFVGIFIARISKGRTIREFVLGVVLAPTLASIIWFSIWGTLGISLGVKGVLTQTDLQQIANLPETGLFTVLFSYPCGRVIAGLTLFLIICFFVTSADSGTFVLAMLTSEGNMNPSKKKKILWGTIQGCFAIILLVSGGLKPLQTISIVAAFPFMLVMIVQLVSLCKELRMEK